MYLQLCPLNLKIFIIIRLEQNGKLRKREKSDNQSVNLKNEKG